VSDVAARVPASGANLLSLVRSDRAAARARLAELSPDQISQACQELRPEVREELLMVVERPEEVVPLFAEAELAATIMASGDPSEAAWLLETASPEQRIACVDLDCWRGYDLQLPAFTGWIDALIEAGRPVLLKAFDEFDPELWVLALLSMADVVVLGREDEPPTGWFTEDGVCYFRGNSDEDFTRVREIAQAAFSEAQPFYWQLVYGMLFESRSECEEYALRWRTARLQDLGFPDREQAMGAWKPLSVDDTPIWDVSSDGEVPDSLVPYEALPQQLVGTRVGAALARLPSDRAADVLGYVLAVANAVAVADSMPLSDSESIPGAMAKALRGIDRGLAELAAARGQPDHEILDRTRPLDLFRVGATLDDGLAPEPLRFADEGDEDGEDEDT
jgi:hypothetical protein